MPKVKMIKIDNKKVIDLCPIHKGQLAVVDFNTLQRLTKNLPEVSLHEIQGDIVSRIKIQDSLQGVLEVMQQELAFHTTVNLVSTISTTDIGEALEEPKAPLESI